MGYVKEEITLKNAADIILAERGIIGASQIHQATVAALVDTGMETLIIGEELCRQLGLEKKERQWMRMANNAEEACEVTEPIRIHWGDRYTVTEAIVMKNADEILVGCIPLEGMDLMVDPVQHKLVGRNGRRVPVCG